MSTVIVTEAPRLRLPALVRIVLVVLAGVLIVPNTASAYTYKRASDPARTIVSSSSGQWLATFTDGSRTVTLAGPARTFAESGRSVTTARWVRLLTTPFAGRVDEAWLKAALADRRPDVLAVAMDYVAGAPSVLDSAGIRIAGDAGYGPLQADGTRQEGSDFNDYLGIGWSYGDSVDQPESAQYGDLDCSGFVRMVFGYRGGVPLRLAPDGSGLPRRSFEMLASAPGVVTIKNSGARSTAYKRLSAGDLVFFDASSDDGSQIDHTGIYLGLDSARHHRFISSRKTIDGPTIADTAGASILDGSGHYATAFRAARRL